MQIKLDENLPAILAEELAGQGHDTTTSPQEGLTGQPDQCVWQSAVNEDRVLITQDLDFSDVRRFVPGTHPGLILIRLDHPSRMALVRRIKEVLRTEDVEAWKGCFVVVSDAKIRIRRP